MVKVYNLLFINCAKIYLTQKKETKMDELHFGLLYKNVFQITSNQPNSALLLQFLPKHPLLFAFR
jgi:hypothetical protein